MPPKPWERSDIRVDDPVTEAVSSPKPWASSRDTGPVEIVPESSTSTVGPPSSRPWEVTNYGTSRYGGNGNVGVVPYGAGGYGGYGAGGYGGYPCGQPGLMDPNNTGVLGAFASVMGCVGRITFLVESNAAALHYFMGALLQLLERFGSVYHDIARLVVRILFRRRRKADFERHWR